MRTPITHLNVILDLNVPYVFIGRNSVDDSQTMTRMYRTNSMRVTQLAIACDNLARKGTITIVPTAFGWWVDFKPGKKYAHRL